jgi:hypothetical protein
MTDRVPRFGKLLVGAAGICALAACVNPSARIASSLTRYGLDAQQSQCVGDRLQANLSVGQLQKLGRAARAFNESDTSPGRLTPSDFARVAARVEDPQVPVEVAKAAAGCGMLDTAIGRL